MWHGMGDNCCNHMSMGAIEHLIQGAIGDNVYVHSIMIGNTPDDDTKAGVCIRQLRSYALVVFFSGNCV
jgi:hypothetical protein